MSFANITAVGNLGRNPELRYTPQGTAVADFSIAIGDRKKDKQGNWQNVTVWYKCVVWGEQAKNIGKYFAKGDQIAVSGTLSVEDWTDREGAARYTLVINVSGWGFAGKTSGGGEAQEEEVTHTGGGRELTDYEKQQNDEMDW